MLRVLNLGVRGKSWGLRVEGWGLRVGGYGVGVEGFTAEGRGLRVFAIQTWGFEVGRIEQRGWWYEEGEGDVLEERTEKENREVKEACETQRRMGEMEMERERERERERGLFITRGAGAGLIFQMCPSVLFVLSALISLLTSCPLSLSPLPLASRYR
jgi:hypothetical protein